MKILLEQDHILHEEPLRIVKITFQDLGVVRNRVNVHENAFNTLAERFQSALNSLALKTLQTHHVLNYVTI